MSSGSSDCVMEFSKYCRCDSIFESKYLRYDAHTELGISDARGGDGRTHRAGGTKVLRCFPHCCPSHVFNSVCGTSIVTRVSGPRVEHSITYLRFEASYEQQLHVGDEIDEASVLSNVRRQTHCIGEWIASHYDVYDENTTTRVCEFSPKAQSTLGWHYRWVGGSARQQRRAMHYLRAYAFERVGHGQLRVLSTVQSTPFIVMSYRRACKACQRQTPEDMAATDLQCECEGIYRMQQQGGEASTAAMDTGDGSQPEDEPTPSSQGQRVVAASPGLDEMEKMLATFYYVVATFPATFLDHHVHPIDAFFRRSSLLASCPPILPPFLHHGGRHQVATGSQYAPTLDAIAVLLTTAVQLLPATQALLATHAATLLHKPDLEQTYARLVHQLVADFNQALRPLHTTFSSVVQAMLAYCHDHHTLSASAAVLLKCHEFHPTRAFESFVAQMRETFMVQYIAIETPPHVPHQNSLSHPSAGSWHFRETQSVAVHDVSGGPSILSLLRACTMGVAFRLALHASSFFIQSQLSASHWSEFILDHRPRVLRVFPNGETTMSCVSDAMHGDYVGHVDVHSAIKMTLFFWPASPTSPSRVAYIVQLHFALADARVAQLQVHVTAAPEAAGPPRDYWGMDVTQRVALLDRTNEQPVLDCHVVYDRVI
ncbi:Aste57867_8892 [Aphanomyces stellatus]|uniref:Aste57867_8892 protein n=1 Tax=Aphanomyces stellatus TaxID=120398 RepID=A0A485KLL7_9STRA|nr:hypothetical protein As57867_008857 [Aphanomyces stellatus]VFT85776.1 Aste57867_8892 [Aphanomyces stellatus]